MAYSEQKTSDCFLVLVGLFTAESYSNLLEPQHECMQGMILTFTLCYFNLLYYYLTDQLSP